MQTMYTYDEEFPILDREVEIAYSSLTHTLYNHIHKQNIRFLKMYINEEEESLNLQITKRLKFQITCIKNNINSFKITKFDGTKEIESLTLSKITIENIQAVQRVHAEGRAVIYVTTHYSSWELGGASIGAFIEPLIAVYKKMKNQEYENWLLEARGAFGNISMEKTNVVKPLVRNLKKGLACGLLIDTNINSKEGVMIDFMGKKLRQTSTPAYLARKFNAAIIPVTMRTDDEENYTLMLFDEIVVQKSEDEQADIQKATQLQADWLTALIRKEPKFWFWLHRRWKNDKPEIYKKREK